MKKKHMDANRTLSFLTLIGGFFCSCLVTSADVSIRYGRSTLTGAYEDILDDFGQASILSESTRQGAKLLKQGDVETAKRLFQYAASKNEARAVFALGVIAEKGYLTVAGESIKPDYSEATQHYEKSRYMGLDVAGIYLGKLLAKRSENPSEQGKGIELLTELADKGVSDAMIELGDIYATGIGAPKNVSLAIDWFKKAEKKGSAYAAYKLASMQDIEQNKVEYWLQRARKAGCVEANYALSELHLKARKRNVKKALSYLEDVKGEDRGEVYYRIAQLHQDLGEEDQALSAYQRASEMGHPLACHYLGELYTRGDVLPHSPELAFRFYSYAAEAGLPVSLYKVSQMLNEGVGTPKDTNKGVEVLRKSAQRGYMLAQYELGKNLHRWSTVSQDPSEALRWFIQAARQGYVPALFEIGVAQENGIGTEKSLEDALTQYQRAAKCGHEESRIKMSQATLAGDVVPKDEVKSYAYLIGLNDLPSSVASYRDQLDDKLSEWDKVAARDFKVKGF